MSENAAIEAFRALRHDVEQFDDAPFIDPDSDLFSNRVPLYMKSYLVNWLRLFVREYGDDVERAFAAKAKADQPTI